MPTTVSIPFNLADDDQAQAFRVATAAEDTFNVLIAFYQHALERRDSHAHMPDPQRHEIRSQLRERMIQHSVFWVVSPAADNPRLYARLPLIVTMTVELGFAFTAISHAQDLFVAVRGIYASLQEPGLTVRWADVVATILARLQPNALADAFHEELEARHVA